MQVRVEVCLHPPESPERPRVLGLSFVQPQRVGLGAIQRLQLFSVGCVASSRVGVIAFHWLRTTASRKVKNSSNKLNHSPVCLTVIYERTLISIEGPRTLPASGVVPARPAAGPRSSRASRAVRARYNVHDLQLLRVVPYLRALCASTWCNLAS